MAICVRNENPGEQCCWFSSKKLIKNVVLSSWIKRLFFRKRHSRTHFDYIVLTVLCRFPSENTPCLFSWKDRQNIFFVFESGSEENGQIFWKNCLYLNYSLSHVLVHKEFSMQLTVVSSWRPEKNFLRVENSWVRSTNSRPLFRYPKRLKMLIETRIRFSKFIYCWFKPSNCKILQMSELGIHELLAARRDK